MLSKILHVKFFFFSASFRKLIRFLTSSDFFYVMSNKNMFNAITIIFAGSLDMSWQKWLTKRNNICKTSEAQLQYCFAHMSSLSYLITKTNYI